MKRILQILGEVRAALLSGDPHAALHALERLAGRLESDGLNEDQRATLEPILAELRTMAEAALRGATMAATDVQIIVTTARSLQTYDCTGRRQTTLATAPAPQRF
ncbi:MAG: hypothetical protein P3W94_003700 [Paracoccus sp. (in: a-proteobacteria)]|nr:hypothetical protein [Paracoccus sp. (in: a-proteobacteria)]